MVKNTVLLNAVCFAVLFCTLVSGAYAGKENCKKVNIYVINDSDATIKVVDIKYFDSSILRWRNESGVSAKLLGKGKNNILYKRNLEEVKNDPNVRVKVKYKVYLPYGNGAWMPAEWSEPSTAKKCVTNTMYWVKITGDYIRDNYN